MRMRDVDNKKKNMIDFENVMLEKDAMNKLEIKEEQMKAS